VLPWSRYDTIIHGNRILSSPHAGERAWLKGLALNHVELGRGSPSLAAPLWMATPPPPWWPHGRDFLATRRVHPSQAQLATVWPRRSPSLPQASGQLRPSPRRQPALQLLRGDDHTTAGIRAPFRCLQGALASQLRSGIKHERPCTSGLQEASRAQIFYSLVPHPHCSGAAHDLEVSGDASFLLSRLVSPISVGR